MARAMGKKRPMWPWLVAALIVVVVVVVLVLTLA